MTAVPAAASLAGQRRPGDGRISSLRSHNPSLMSRPADSYLARLRSLSQKA